jgi:hypothetical protein
MPNIVGLFIQITNLLCTAVGAHLARQARGPMVVLLGSRYFAQIEAPSPHKPIALDIWQLLARRALRLAARFRSLHARWAAGTLPAPRPRQPQVSAKAGAGASTTPRQPALRLPRERGWINKRIPEAAPCGGNLQALLYLPECDRFVAEVPRAGRLLRPLCHALGVDLTPVLRLPTRAHTPRPPRSRQSRARPGLNDPTLKLRPWERSWIRASWKKYGRD